MEEPPNASVARDDQELAVDRLTDAEPGPVVFDRKLVPSKKFEELDHAGSEGSLTMENITSLWMLITS